MATKKRPTPKAKPKTKAKPRTAARRPAARKEAFAPAPAPVQVQPQESKRGLGVLIVAVALVGLFIWRAGRRPAPTPQPMPVAAAPATTPEGRTPAKKLVLPPIQPETGPRMATAHRSPAGEASIGEADGASQTFDRSQGSLALRCWRPEGGVATLEVFGSRNLKVRLMQSESGAAGWKVLQWDGKDEQGKKVPAGLYYLRVSTEGTQQVRDIWVKG
jgi:hypothetical protein